MPTWQGGGCLSCTAHRLLQQHLPLNTPLAHQVGHELVTERVPVLNSQQFECVQSALVLCKVTHVGATLLCQALVSLFLSALNSCALNNGGCEHDCVQVTLAQHRCQCWHNHQLHEDGKRCICESLGHAWGGLGSHGFQLGAALGWGCSDVRQIRQTGGISSKNSVCFVVMDISCGLFQGMGRAGGV